MKKKHILFSTIISMGMMVSSCSDYLSVEGKLGENTQSLENIFENKEWSEQWLATAYAWLTWSNIDIGSKDNCITNFSDDMCYSDRNLEYRVFKYCEYDENWKQDSWAQAYDGIRHASIFIHNIDRNKEMTPDEIVDYKAQARFVRAYFYWKLLQKYGPIPIIPNDGVMDYNAAYEDLYIPRSTYDDCVNYIAEEMKLAAKDLPLKRDTRNMARPTRGAALATRAKALLYAASPLNNPRPTDTERFTDLVDDEGRYLMAQEYNEEKWAKAAAAARDVVELGRKGVYELHTVSAHSTGTIDNPATIAPPTHAVYSHVDFPAGWRNIDPLQSYETLFNGVIFPSENKEMIFTTGQNNGDINTMIQHQMPIAFGGYNCHAMTGKQCDAYQMNTGKPFDKTKDWTGDENYVSAEEAASGDWAPLVEGVNKQYGHREPRFYATVAYNGCLWNGTNAVQSYDRNLIIWYYRGEESGWSNSGDRWLATGIGIRKFVSSRDNFKTEGGVISKPVIGIRYADVLLWYAEALNELGASTYQIPSWDGTQSYDISRDKNEMSYAISRVRIRGGVPDFGSDVYENADEFRKHLKHERQIELFAENSRYFDLRRWKDAEYEESQQMYGCNAYMSKKERDLFHTQVINSNLPTTFSRKMYFWPISHDQLRRNLRLTQNPGWTYYD